jgi:transcriptional regulator of acetoin/glycerol metabolism
LTSPAFAPTRNAQSNQRWNKQTTGWLCSLSRVLLRAVEEMPSAVQEAFIDLLTELESARRPSATVRLISGTTVSLLDRVSAGTFSERLFYRLNIILRVGNGSPARALI